ncbi:SDR family oxidoreductase [soil metagenome]
MRLLVLGGTEFVGRAVVHEALAAGWQVTVFNRGSHRAADGVEAVVGDRTEPGALAALGAGTWDVVVDTWSWAPRAVRDSAAALADRAASYVYVSSRSVYDDPPAGACETSPVVEASPDAAQSSYAADKRGAELGAIAAFGDRALVLRPGLIIGPHENVGRLPWWLARSARGGRMLAPGPAASGIQFVDARDLARFCLSAAERGLGGAFDVVSPVDRASFGDLIAACVAVTGSVADPVWVDPETILAAGISPWTELPVWLPPGVDHDALHRSDTAKAAAAGLVIRPLEETVADTWEWLQSPGAVVAQRPDRPPGGLDAEIEARVLAEAVQPLA